MSGTATLVEPSTKKDKGFTFYRAQMFRDFEAGEIDKLDPELLDVGECRICGERLRARLINGNVQYSKCEFCEPIFCEWCESPCEIGQIRAARKVLNKDIPGIIFERCTKPDCKFYKEAEI